MHGYQSIFVAVSVLVSLAAAATSSVCADHAVFQSCLGTTQGMITAYCTSTTDYNCLCQRWTANANCYDSCPNDPGKAAAYSTRDTYCNDAIVYTSTGGSSAYSAPATTSSSAAAAAATTAGVDGGAVRTSSASAPAATKSNAAGRQSVGGLAVALGGLAVFL